MTTASHHDLPGTVGRTEVFTPDDTSIVMTRAFRATRELVWETWTDPGLVPKFWGMREHRNELLEWDLHPGGAWRIVTTTPDGTRVDFHGEFVRVEEPSLLEWTFGFDDTPPGPETLYLDERDGVTTMRSVSTFPSRAIRDMVLDTGMETGASQMHDKFAELLAERVG